MKALYRDFVSYEPREFKFKIGTTIASSLSGFVAGVIFTTIVLAVIFAIFMMFGIVSFGG